MARTEGVSEGAEAALGQLYRGRRVVVAGATGFLGINCALGLRAAGARVVGVARRATARAELACDELVEVDLATPEAAEELVEGASVVFDCLGYPALGPTALEPRGNLDAELRPHINLFLACAKLDASPVVVHAGTRLVYGTPQRLPVDEAHPVSPRCVYAVHKLLIEQYLSVLARTHRLRSVVFRLSGPYGPNGPAEPGRLGVWNQFIRKAMLGEPLVVYGEGNQVRDLIYIEDVVSAFLLAAVTERCWGEIFNLGGERALSLRQAVAIIAKEAGGSPVRHTPWPEAARVVETGDYRSDLTKIRRFIPMPPQTPFEEGLRRTIEAMRVEAAEAEAASRPAAVPAGYVRIAKAAPRPLDGFHTRRVLVTGASGFIGSHLVSRFLEEGATVHALSRSVGRVRPLVDAGACTFVPCDLTDADATRQAVAAARPYAVLHIASCPDGEETAELARERLTVNIQGTLNLLEACRKEAPAARFVYGDSRKVYGNAPAPHRSTTSPSPNSSYAVSKATGWHLCELYGRLHGLTTVSVRPALIYGPGQGMNLIRAVAEAAQRGEAAIRLKGGDQRRDPLFIDDAVEAFVCAARRAEELAGRVIVIGGAEELAVRDLASLVLKVCMSAAAVVCGPQEVRPTEIWRGACDLLEAEAVLGWRPRVGLREGIERTLCALVPKQCVA